MARILLCLPLCLLLAPSYPGATVHQASLPTQQVEVQGPITTGGLPDPAKDVVGFLEACLKRYHETVQGFTCSFRKRERTGGELHPWETIAANYRESPQSALFEWQEGARQGVRRVTKALYVEGENKNAKGQSQILALTLLGVMKFDVDSADSKSSARYTLNEFGLKQALMRVLNAWKAAQAEKTLHVEYLGLHKVPEVGGQLCHKIHRHKYARPEGADGITDVVIFIDRETLFQVGTIVKGENEQLLGEYYFRDIQLNPDFPAGLFEPGTLKGKK
jgi:hypothetical protein